MPSSNARRALRLAKQIETKASARQTVWNAGGDEPRAVQRLTEDLNGIDGHTGSGLYARRRELEAQPDRRPR